MCMDPKKRWQKLLRSGSTALSYQNCVITLVGGWWGQSIARAFTRMMKKKVYGPQKIKLKVLKHKVECLYVYKNRNVLDSIKETR